MFVPQLRLLVVCSLIVSFAAALHATPTQPISYQGRLTDNSGNPVADGTYNVTFAIYAEPVKGSALWTESQDVTIADGLFTALLGSVISFEPALFKEFPRYLGITVGANPEMTPRILMTSVPYVLNPTSSYWVQAGSNIYYNSGNVGIGTTTPTSTLEVSGDLTVSKQEGPRLNLKATNTGGARPRISFGGDYLAIFDGDATTGHIFSFMNTFGPTRDYDASLRVHGRAVNSWGTFLDLTHDGTRGIISTDVGDISLMPASGKVGIGTASPTDPLEVNGGVTVSKNDGPRFTFRDNTMGGERPRISFGGDYLAIFDGDATTGQVFSFMNTFSNVRDYDAMLRIHGRTMGSWGTALDLTHDGTRGILSTDVGDISLMSASGNVSIGGVSSTSEGVHIGRDANAYIEMAGGTPHIDLKYNAASDFDARIMLDGAGLAIYAANIAIGGVPNSTATVNISGAGHLRALRAFNTDGEAIDAFVDGQGDYALTAYSDNSVGSGVALWGYCPSPNGYAVYHNGRLGGVGLALNQMDHPLDPTNKSINNYSVESTEPTYSYRGNVVLDANGEAWVMLPDYAEAITKDFQYQLTPVGASAPNLYIAQEVSGNKFKISGGSGGLKVSWTVTGSRNDLYVQKYGAPSVETKSAAQRGKYLQPELYNAPASMGVFYRDEPKSTAVKSK